MTSKNIYFLTLALIFGILSFTILYPFIIVISLAYIFSILLKPIYKIINKKLNSTLSSIITIFLFLILIVTPFTLIFTKIFIDAQNFTNSFELGDIYNYLPDFVKSYLPKIDIDISAILKSISSFVVTNIGDVLSSTVDIVLKFFLFIMTLFYLLKENKQIKNNYKELSPLSDDENLQLKNTFKDSIYSILLGSLSVSIAQGIITGLGFLIFDVPNAFFLGAVAGLLALIPGVGPAIVWIPASIYLYINNPESFAWLYQILWGIIAVGLIDNLLGPLVINRGVKINQIFILLSIIGGIYLFGPEGFIFGPLILSMFYEIIKLWRVSFKKIS